MRRASIPLGLIDWVTTDTDIMEMDLIDKAMIYKGETISIVL